MRKLINTLLFCIATVVIFPVSPSHSSEPSNALKAGVVKVDITPQDPVRMSGYAGRKDLSSGVHDQLYARVMSFQCDADRLVIVSTDLIGFYGTYEPIRDAICAKYDLRPNQLFLSSTHTHAGPTPSLDDTPHPNNLKYTRELRDKLIEAVGQAMDAHVPVEYGIGRGYSPVGSNRRERRPDGSVWLGRNPYGPTDKEVLVMKLVATEEESTTVVFDYATHATSMGPKNLEISGDVLGIAAQYVEKILGPDVISPVFAGASGDIDPWYRVLPEFKTANGWIPETELLGQLLGTEVLHVAADIKTESKSPIIASKFSSLELPAKVTDGDSGSSTKKLNVTVARIGNIGFVGLGCELLTEIGISIKAHSPFEHTFVITHCNGGAGYLAPSKLYADGGYEIRSTKFAPEAADLLVKQTVEMLKELK